MLQYVCTPKALGGFFDVSIDLSWLLYGNWKKKKKKWYSYVVSKLTVM